MESIKYLYNIGYGPSSSHTMGPSKAASIIRNKYPDANKYEVILFNSLALTGYGHLTFNAIEEELKSSEVQFFTEVDQTEHPNTVVFKVFQDSLLLGTEKVISIGGSKIIFNGAKTKYNSKVYPHHFFKAIKGYCFKKKISLFEYVLLMEGSSIKDYLLIVWQQMKKTIRNGLQRTGFLPGSLQVRRKAKRLYLASGNLATVDDETRLIAAFAFACSEENAGGGIVVTAPTCGSCGVLPSVLYYYYQQALFTEEKIIEALAVASVFGNLLKSNASISGAEAGCQAEIGSACAMTAAAIAYLRGYALSEIEYAAEVALEHSLGLTCDPVRGYVQIPCIERNAIFAMKALDAARLAGIITYGSKVSFDTVVETMFETGKALGKEYRETAEGGLAKYYKEKKVKKKND